MRRTAIVAAVLLLGACGRETAPLPAPPKAEQVQPVQTLDATIVEHGAIRVPRRAVVERTGITGVFVLSPDKEARFRLVKTGRVRGDAVEILAGLHGTETLVLGDLRDVHDGTPIRPE